MVDLLPNVKDAAKSFLELSALLRKATAIQWMPAPIPRPREDTASRSQGGYSNPTQDAALDARRLAVRAAVLNAEGVLRDFRHAMHHALHQLRRAIARWEGE